MDMVKEKTISVETDINIPIEKVWSYWTEPKHITQWCFASDDWYAPRAENELKVEGKFRTRMAARDGSTGFDFEGIYTKVLRHKAIEYTIADGRKVRITFLNHGTETKVTEFFEAETENSYEAQRGGWQAILNNFKKYCESKQ